MVFERALAKSPEDRFQSCAEYVTALREAIGGEVRYPASAPTLTAAALPKRGGTDPLAPTQLQTDRAEAQPQKRFRRLPVIGAAVAAVAIASAVALYVTRQENSDEPEPPAPQTVNATATTAERTTFAPPVTTPLPISTMAPTTSVETPPPPATYETTAVSPPSIYAGMPCDSPGAESPDGRFGCSGLNRIWVDRYAPPLPTIGWDAIGAPCTEPGAKARLQASDGVLTCIPTDGGSYVWVSGPY
jgi:hypothetical protein